MNALEWYNRHKEPINIAVSLATIISMLFAGISLVIFVLDQQDQKRVKEENLKSEISYNIQLIDELQKNECRTKTSGEFLSNRFRFTYAEQSMTSIRNVTIRKKIMLSIEIMRNVNTEMDFFSGGFIPFPNEQSRNDYELLKHERVISIYKTIEPLKQLLFEIQNDLNSNILDQMQLPDSKIFC